MPNLANLFVPSLLALGLAACGGPGGIALDDLAETEANEACARAVECGDYPDVATCLEANPADGFAEAEADVEAGLITYDADAARDCLDALDDTPACEFIFEDPSIDHANEVCGDVFTGTVPLGGVCVRDVQCVDDNLCEPDPSCTEECCAGTCVANENEEAAVGESCLTANCVSGAFCDAKDICVAYLDIGEPCEDFFACVSGAFCNLDFSTGMGTCIELVDTGETCEPDALIACLQTNDYCDATTSLCTTNSDVGEPCDSELGNCVGYAYCDVDTCAARASLGDTCVVDGEPECLGDLNCVAGVCEAPDPGEVCTL